MERLAENLDEEDQVQNVSTVSEVREVKRSKRSLKQSEIDANAVKFDLKSVSTKQKLSLKSVEVSGDLSMVEFLFRTIIQICLINLFGLSC